MRELATAFCMARGGESYGGVWLYDVVETMFAMVEMPRAERG